MAGGPKVAVLGAGSVGCFIGGAWAVAGLDVTFIGRPKLSSDIDEHGLTLSDYSGWQAHLPAGDVDYRCGPEGLADAEVIALAVKSGGTAEAAAEIAAHGTPGALVISFQNGISNVEVLEQGLGGRFEIARGMVQYNVAYLGEGRFHKGVAGDLYADRRAGTRALAETIGGGPAGLKLSDDMLGLGWGKLLINLNNALVALSGLPLASELADRRWRLILAGQIDEALAAMRASHIAPARIGGLRPGLLPKLLRLPDWLFRLVARRMLAIDPQARSSMWDDLQRGRQTEIGDLQGAVLSLAEKAGTPAPLLKRVSALVRQAEREKRGSPGLTPEAVTG
jgi:2-dehydropantoate 2-reductase